MQTDPNDPASPYPSIDPKQFEAFVCQAVISFNQAQKPIALSHCWGKET